MVLLPQITEDAIVNNLRKRFMDDYIFVPWASGGVAHEGGQRDRRMADPGREGWRVDEHRKGCHRDLSTEGTCDMQRPEPNNGGWDGQ